MQTQDLIGQQLGNYRLSALLGKGGFAKVYLGEHIFLGSQAKAAIKVLNETKLSDEDRQSFLTEARTIRKLNHPSIVKVLEFGIEVSRNVDGSIPYLVMDYAPNGTLRNRHARRVIVPIQQIVSYVDQVAEGLQYAHDLGTIHRDVKPENMLVMSMNDIVLSDFGIAVTSYDSKNHIQTKEGMVQGTFAYIAPERFRGSTRRASDQYALGIVVYEWLSGNLPFKGTPEEIIYHHFHTPPPPLHGIYPHISQEIEVAVMRALAKDPEQRYPSIKDFAEALHFAAHLSAQSNPQPVYELVYEEKSEHRASPEDLSEHNSLIEEQIDSETITEKVSLKEYQGERTELMEHQVDSGKREIDSDEQLLPIASEQPKETVESFQDYRGTKVDADIQLRDHQDQAHQSRQSQAYAERQQQVYSFFQTWQQNMEYTPAITHRKTASFKPEPFAETPPVILLKKASQRTFVSKLRKWFEIDSDFARIPRNKIFRNIGMLLNVLAAILVGILAQPPSGWLIFFGLLYSLGLFNLCIRFVNVKLSIGAGLLVAVFWGVVSIVIWNGIYVYGPYITNVSPFLITFLPPSLVALFFFSASAYLHIRYVMGRLP